jgi:FkbM family methyltransferase
MSRKRRSLFGTLREPGILGLRMWPLWLSSPMLFLSSLRNTCLRQPQTYLGDHTLLIQTIFGHAMYLDGRDISLTPHLLRQGCWEPDVTRFFLRLVKPGMHIVEVGANVGYYTLLACSLVGPTGRVTAFEANPASVALTRRSLLVNGFRDRATITGMAIIDAPGAVVLHRLDQRQGDSSIFDFSDEQLAFAGDRVTKLEVPATSLDAFFEKDDPIDLIRMDVEGAEPLVFDGMRHILERNPRIQIMLEFFPERIQRSGRQPAKFLESIKGMGFRIQTVGSRGRLQELPIEILAERLLSELFLSRERRLPA